LRQKETQQKTAVMEALAPQLEPLDSSSTGKNQTSVQRRVEVAERLAENSSAARPVLEQVRARLDNSQSIAETQRMAAVAESAKHPCLALAGETGALDATAQEEADRFFFL
jgi:hypothetical protein